MEPDGRPALVDTHAHLTHDHFHADLTGALDRARQAGVLQILTMGTTAQDSQHATDLARDHAGVFAAVAIHPNDVADSAPGDFDTIDRLASGGRAVAVGETGLDRHWNRTPFDRQIALFEHHLDLARRLDLPVVIHCRDCYEDVIRCLENQPQPVRGVLHSFASHSAHATALLHLGLHISVAGMVTFQNKALDELRTAVQEVPADRLLIETDSPYLSPHPLRGRKNEPARLGLTAACVAELRGVGYSELAEQTTRNARLLFRLPDSTVQTTGVSLPP